MTGAALAMTLLLTVLLLVVVLWNGLGVFWPWPVPEVTRVVGVFDADGALAEKVRQAAAERNEEFQQRWPTIDWIDARLNELRAALVRREKADGTLVLDDGREMRAGKLRKVLREELAEALETGSATPPDGQAIEFDENGNVALADGTQYLLDGTVVLPDGARRLGDGTVVLADRTRVAADGKILLAVALGGAVPAVDGSEMPEEDTHVAVPLVNASDVHKVPAEDGAFIATAEGFDETFEILDDGRMVTRLLGHRLSSEVNPDTGVRSVKFKIGNKEDGAAFCWIEEASILGYEYRDDAYVLKRMKHLDGYGYLREVHTEGLGLSGEGPLEERLAAALDAVREKQETEVEPLADQGEELTYRLKQVQQSMYKANYRRKQLLADGLDEASDEVAEIDAELADIRQQIGRLKEDSDALTQRQSRLEDELRRNNYAVFDVLTSQEDGGRKQVALVDIVRFHTPNDMGFLAKVGHYLGEVWAVLTEDPREANQDGGLFPAIFGTVLLVFLMAITCFPLGVLAGIYLGEYAKDGPLVRLVRIAVNNLAGVPSIVYGIFGLGFFIYLVGYQLDSWFYPELLEPEVGQRVFGQPAIIWASLTLGLLTIPVVIVATEEALRQIPRGVKEGSYALGATKFQTLTRVLGPMASPGIMTGFILAMARAAGEVAPLMITGAVKSSPVPLDSHAPFVHVDRQFMHLGFHIYDISCKSPNIEATKPMVYVTTLLLLAIVLTMTSLAIWLRNRMRKKYELKTI